MISVLDAAAVVTSEWSGSSSWPKIKVVPPLKAQRVLSPCARYAIDAVAGLDRKQIPQAMVCLCGPTGITAEAFEPARKQSLDGKIWGPDFTRRSRRIHPLTLIRSLQNQVPAALSQKFHIHGPVLNTLETATALTYLLPNIQCLLDRYQQVLLVLASAGDRMEENAKRQCFQPGTLGGEGAFVFVLGNVKGFGELLPMSSANTADLASSPITDTCMWGDSILAAGHLLLTCLIEKPNQKVLEFSDTWGHRTRIHWKGH